MAKRQWREDHDAETILREIVGVDFTVETLSLTDIDWAESANNCARLSDPLNAEKIEDYATCMNRGDVFPRIVAEPSHRAGQFIILGGNQRSAALKSIDPKSDIECYVTQPLTDDERELVIRSLNSRHGWGSTKEERMEHAVFLVRRYGMHVETVARAMVVSGTQITHRIRAEDERARLARNGIDSSRMPLRALTSLASVADESTRNTIAKASLEVKATGDKVAELASSVNKAKSRAMAAKAIADFKKSAIATKEITATKTGKLKKPRREKFLDLLTKTSEFLELGNDGHAFSTLNELCCTPEHDLDNIRMLTAKITSRLHCICEAGK